MKIMKNTRIVFMSLLLAFAAIKTQANEIIFSQRYTADPCVVVYNGRVYVYLSHDLDDQRDFSMDGYTCISSDDLLNWTDHGEVLMASEIPYISVQGKQVFWAPEAIERDGKFYLYFCTPDYGNDPLTTGTGVCVSDSPLGPFTDPRGNLMITGHRVDIGVLIDDDGQAYAYWPNGLVRKLAANMYDYSDTHEYNVWNNDAHEAPFVRKINDKYYYMYMTFNDQELWACSQHNMPPDGCGQTGDYFHRYNFLATPTGPVIEPGGVFGRTMMWPVQGDNTQPAVFEFGGNYYSLYHSKILSALRNENYGYQRNVGLDRIYFNPDGTIIPQTITKEGLKQVKYLNPYIRQEAETIGREERIETEACNDEGGGRMVSDIDSRDWIKMFGVDFGNGASAFEARVASPLGGTIEVRLDSVNGTTVARLNVPATGGYDSWQTVNTDVSGATGVHDVYFVFTLGGFHFNWWKFTGGEISGMAPGKMTKTISIRSHANNKYLTASASQLIASSDAVGINERYRLEDNEDGSYSIFSLGQNKYISNASGIQAIKTGIDGIAEKFILLQTPDGSYCFFSMSDSSYVVAPGNGSSALTSGITHPWKDPDREISRFFLDYLDEPSEKPVCTGSSMPYKVNTIPGIIEAENFNYSCVEEGYKDNDATNVSRAYRPDEGVDIVATKDGSGAYDVSFIATGEWLNYTVNVNESGYFEFSFRFASTVDDNFFHLEIDELDISGPIKVDKTGAANIYKDIRDTLLLEEGVHQLKVFFDKASRGLTWNLVETKKSSAPSVNKIEITSDYGITVFPNPANLRLYISSDTYYIQKIRILSSDGKLVYESAEPFKGSKSIDISRFSEGAYNTMLFAEDMTLIKKFLKVN